MSNTTTVIGVIFARLRFVAVFVVAGLLVGYWDNIRNHIDKWTRPAVAPDSLAAAAASDIEYYCPMHPEIIRSAPALCPKCGMPLVKRKKGEAVNLPADVLARVQLTPNRISLAGIGTSAVEYRTLHRNILSVGVLDYDESKLARISARVAGRVDELFVTFTGQSIERGQPLYSIYSPEVYTSVREYLLSRKRVNELPKDAGEARMDAGGVYTAALQKLVLWGVTTEQLDKIDHDFDTSGQIPTDLTIASPMAGIVVQKNVTQGQYLQTGDLAYAVADLSRIWLQVKLYERDIPLVNVGDPVEITVEAMPGERFDGVVAFKAYQLDPQTRTLDARVVVENANLRLRPGMFASAHINVPLATRVANATTAPAAAPADQSKRYWDALGPYLKAHQLLTEDKPREIPALLKQTQKLIQPLMADEKARPAVERLNKAMGQIGTTLPSEREAWKEISNAMIEIGKAIGTPPVGPTVKVFRCPMVKANWLQLGEETANPYDTSMLTCGSAVEDLPKAEARLPATRKATVGERMLAIPRSAVIETGTQLVVFVETSPGIYDMRGVKLGPVADGELYPVLEGLREGERVVTAGTFLLDAENRLNPMAKAGGHP